MSGDLMQNYRLAWTTPDGERKTSAVSFSASAAETYQAVYQAREGTDVEIVPVKPGE
ncbi:hypothetical protein [Streptomyces sp. NPDC014746]|uniref:hypothetical protein n=1 Tax=Streptomyces sp. NPDC014746 TaxID=3364904 RepID=UPI0036F68B5A